MPDIALSEVIRALRAELEAAMASGAGQQIRFEATALEVEFQVGVTKSAEGKGGVSFWVFEVGGGASRSKEETQKVTLSLTPILASGEKVKIAKGSGETPLSDKAN